MIRPRLPHHWASALAAFTLAAFPLVTRIELMWEKQLAPGGFDLHGVLADLAVALLIFAVVMALSRLTRIGAAVLSVAWVVLTFANYEHVHTFDAPVTTTLARYLLDPTFFNGSAMHATHPVLLAFALIGAVAPWIRRPAQPSRRALGVVAAVGAMALVIAVAWPVRPRHVSWRQSHFMVLAARTRLEAMFPEPPLGPPSPQVAELFKADLSGQPRIALPGKKRNVLLIFLESFPASALPRLAGHQDVTADGSAPQLDAYAAKRAVLYDNFIAQQRQTNRGEYSVLCGDMPRQSSHQARMTEYVQQGGTRACLPKLLRDAGYTTAYLQAAPTAFMFKEQFMSQIGFDRVIGTEYFSAPYARNRWGVDDRTFFEQAHRLITELHQSEKPFFATMLTVGTHHPYLVPASFRAPGTPWARSVAYADQAVTTLLQNLEQEGVLDDTVVLITGDESNGTFEGDDLTRAVTQNWVPLVAFLPEPDHRGEIVDEPFMQSDLALSLLDYLGLADSRDALIGRSIFRAYSRPRPLYFANVHTERLWAVTTDGVLSGCSENLDDCSSQRVDKVHLFNPNRDDLVWERQRLADWKAVIARGDTILDGAAGPRTIQLASEGTVEVRDRSRPGQVIFAGQYLDLPKDTVLDVDLDVEVKTDGLIALTQDVWGAGRMYYSPSISLLSDGERVRLRYSYRFEKDAHAVEVRLFGRPAQGTRHALLIHGAKMVLHPPASAQGPNGVQHPEIQIAHNTKTLPLRFSIPDFNHPRCVSGGRTLETHGCANGAILFGPYASAPKGSHVTARFEVTLLKGEGDFQAEFSFALGRRRVPGTTAHLTAGDSAILEAELTPAETIELLEARLWASNNPASNELLIKSATLQIDPPPTSAAVVPPAASTGTP